MPVVGLDTRGPGTTRITLEVRGNALLSSLFIKSADVGATVKVNYYQTTTGTFEEDSERFDLTSHPLKGDTDAPETSQVVVTRIHNKPVLEYIVTGGNVEFGVYATVTDELASDIDSALLLDGTTFLPDVHKGIPIMCLDPDENKVFMLRCEGGAIPVFLQDQGDKKNFSFNGVTDPGVVQDLIDTVASATLETSIRKVRVVCRAHGAWELSADGVIITSGLTGPASPNTGETFITPDLLEATKNLKLQFRAHAGTIISKLDAYVQTTQK